MLVSLSDKRILEKLVVVLMGQDAQKFIGMSLESVKDADAIVYCDGGSKDDSIKIAQSLNAVIIQNSYDQEDPSMNGKQRNFYLDYVKKNYPDYFCLAIDADEVVEDLSKIKEFIQDGEGLYSVKMRHLVSDLAHEDSTVPNHFVLNRLFKVSDAKEYPLVEHPVLQPKDNMAIGATNCTTIWHLAYCPNMFEIKKRYESHLAKSNMHTPEYLKSWYFAHLFGTYPKAQFNPVELPDVILNNFGIDKDELYFKDRGLEHKHWLMVDQWKHFFNPNSVTDFGCGRGPYVYVWDKFDVTVKGIDISDWAINNSICERNNIGKLNIIESSAATKRDLVTAIDLLEHISYDDLDSAINNLIESSNKNILLSIPFKGTHNCENDPTHIIKEDRDWWVEQFVSKGLKEVEVPEHFLFKEQLLIFSK